MASPSEGGALVVATAERARLTVEATVREAWGRVLAALVRHLRDFELAEDALQDAVVTALRTWPEKGIPDNPNGWLLKVARNRAIDTLRRATNFDVKRDQLRILSELEAQDEQEDMDQPIADERLRLIFTCCHPALPEPARLALTLRTLGGLTTPEIARAFLVPEKTMAQRLVRAKRKIKEAGIPYRVPPPHLWSERLDSVLSVIYLIFNEGYAATSGEAPSRGDLCREAIQLGRTVMTLAPDEPEVAGLVALMLLHESRRDARTDSAGNFVPLEAQDRTLWKRQLIEAGLALLHGRFRMEDVGPYQIQAAISGAHAAAASFAETDWGEIALLYQRLHQLHPSAVIELNRIVAVSFAEGPEVGLDVLVAMDDVDTLESYQPYHAARADMLRRAGRAEEAANAYRDALALTTNDADRRFLEGRLREVTET